MASRRPVFKWVPFLDRGGVAKSYIDQGIIELSEKELKPLPIAWQYFIMAHEEGHCVEDTQDEWLADNYAFYKWVKYGFPLKESVLAISRILDIDNNPEHSARFDAHVLRVKMYDYYVGGNKALAQELGL